MTLIGDSGVGALLWETGARERLGRGLDLRLEIRACRKLASDSCWQNGQRPPSALETVKTLGKELGRVAVVEVGYNDQPDTYADGIDAVMRAAVAAGVDRVVWVTLRASRPNYAEINRSIEASARRWPQLVVADWDAVSRDRPWFHDGVHLNDLGAAGFASFLRPRLVDACGAACAPGGSMLAIRTGTLPQAKTGAAYRARVAIEGGIPPYRLSVQGLPRPLRIVSDGTITGRPRVSGRFELRVAVTDRGGVRTSGTVRLRIAPP